MRSSLKAFVLSCCLCLVITGPLHGQVKIGILPRLSPAELTKMFTPLANHIGKVIGQRVELVIPKDFDTFNQMMKDKKFDFAYANPNVYTDAREVLGTSVESLAIAVEGGKTFTGCYLVKKGSPIKKIMDFKGKKFVFVDENSAGGYLSQIYSLKQAGISKNDISILPFAKKHTNVALAIQNGTADVGGIRTLDFDKIQKLAAIPDVQIFGESVAIPNWPLFSLPNANKEMAEKIRQAVLGLKPNSPEATAVLSEAKISGFVPAVDADFNLMRKISETAKSY